jgi:hypothetical protein
MYIITGAASLNDIYYALIVLATQPERRAAPRHIGIVGEVIGLIHVDSVISGGVSLSYRVYRSRDESNRRTRFAVRESDLHTQSEPVDPGRLFHSSSLMSIHVVFAASIVTLC